MSLIHKCFSKRTVEEIVSALEEEEATSTNGHVIAANPWLTSTIQSLKKASPISFKMRQQIKQKMSSANIIGNFFW